LSRRREGGERTNLPSPQKGGALNDNLEKDRRMPFRRMASAPSRKGRIKMIAAKRDAGKSELFVRRGEFLQPHT